MACACNGDSPGTTELTNGISFRPIVHGSEPGGVFVPFQNLHLERASLKRKTIDEDMNVNVNGWNLIGGRE